MKYRFEETLTWIIPGFYLLLYIFILVCCLDSSSMGIPENSSSIGVYISILIFTIPILSLILGWFIDAYAGYLFRHTMKGPIRRGYYLAYHKKTTTEDAERKFDEARDRIDLNNVDRFYYRYVFSRNMLTAQFGLMVITLILIFIYNDICSCISMKCLTIGVVLFFIFLPIVRRDLTTHVKYVFLEDKKKVH